MKAVLCPVCKGEGFIAQYLGDPHSTAGCTPLPPKLCHGCAGKGWVEVSEHDTFITPWFDAKPRTDHDYHPD